MRRTGLPDGLEIPTMPHLASEYLTGREPTRRHICTLELPEKLPPSLNALKVEMTPGVHTTETYIRAQKLRNFALACSPAIDNVFFGGQDVATDKKLLDANGITHVVNCVCQEVHNAFVQDLNYMELFLQDAGNEDILAVLYDVFDFIQEAKELHGNVYIHCSQGVSRSAAMVIAYVMWKKKQGYEVTKDALKEKRGVVDPNVNFCAQLMVLQKSFLPTSDRLLRIYRIASQSARLPCYLVPKLLRQSRDDEEYGSIILDPRGTFVIHLPTRVYVWKGARHKPPYVDAARRFTEQLSKYENAPEAVEVYQGHEPNEFFTLIAEQCLDKRVVVAKEGGESFTSDYERFDRGSGDISEGSNCRPFRRPFSQS